MRRKTFISKSELKGGSVKKRRDRDPRKRLLANFGIVQGYGRKAVLAAMLSIAPTTASDRVKGIW